MVVSQWIARVSLGLAIVVWSCAQSQSKKDPSVPKQMDQTPKTADGEGTQTFTSEDKTFTLYPAQVESWNKGVLKERAVVSVQTPSSPQPVYGLIWLTSKTRVDSGTRRVSFENVRITKAQFPSAPELEDATIKALSAQKAQLLKPVAEENLKSNLAIEKAEANVEPVPLRNGPPKIVVKRSPTLLVLVDGAPVLRDAGAQGLMRVINTRALILFDSTKGRYFFYMGDRWMDALSIQGPWIETDQPSPSLEQAKKIAVDEKQVDLLNDPRSSLMKNLAQHIIPEVYVSTESTEILETVGKPEFKSISGTHLLFVENSENNIFLDQRDQNYYVLLSGRWYRAKSLQGPWRYVPATQLPKDFAKIPENHHKGSILASVPETQQAGEAKISNEVPQTARIDRSQAMLEVKYDGPPEFKAIEQTQLQYAENTKTPVIKVSSNSFYALQSGVWFESSSSEGPWKVATRVPSVIYTIPPSSPIYYVTYVRIYDATSDSVYVGYTPGYLGTYCCSDGVVVYGTGYYYPPWIGTYWIGPPVTFGIGFSWGYGGGYFAGPVFYPWWGPWWSVPVYVGYPYVAIGAAPVGAGTVYEGWSTGVVQTQNPAPFQSGYTGKGGQWGMAGQAAAPSTAPNSVAQNPSLWNPPVSQSPNTNSGQWGMGHAAAPPPPPPAPPPVMAPPPSVGGNAGAMSHGFSGGGWSAHK